LRQFRGAGQAENLRILYNPDGRQSAAALKAASFVFGAPLSNKLATESTTVRADFTI
jgi:hypothetical protein